MRRRTARGVAFALVAAAAGATAWAADPAPSNDAYKRWWATNTDRGTRAAAGPVTVNKPKPRDTGAALRAQEEANLLRRLAVCDKLRQLAAESGDDALEQEADKLEAQAREVYEKRTAHLPSSKAVAQLDDDQTDTPAPKARDKEAKP